MDVFASADTLEHNGLVQRYQWSDGCHTEPNIRSYTMLAPNTPGISHGTVQLIHH